MEYAVNAVHCIYPPGEHIFACRVCHELTYESTKKSGSLHYELIKRPLEIHNKAFAALKRSRFVAMARSNNSKERTGGADTGGRVLAFAGCGGNP